MKKIKYFFIFLLTLSMLINCTDKEQFLEPIEETLEMHLKGAYNDGYFDWDRVNDITYKNEYGQEKQVSLPWLAGSTNNSGISVDWIDEDNVHNPNFAKRYYSRENGWVMVYSNVTSQSQVGKYFALYNKYSGLLRFFLFPEDGTSHSSVFMGINVGTTTSLFNFSNPSAEATDSRKNYPALTFSPSWTLNGTNFFNTGYKPKNWYGFEVECAYDPNLTDAKFQLAIWAANVTITTGEALTTGSITGTIKSNSSNAPNLDLKLSFDKNSSTTNSVVANNESGVNAVSSKIDEGVKKNDKFFTKLWNDVKSNATKWIGSGVTGGVKEGLKAILSSGGSIVTNVLGNVFSSLFGGNKESISKVELELNSKTTIKLESHTFMPGMGPISLLPVPGANNNVNELPLYNQPLGVWNLSQTPTVELSTTHYTARLPYYNQYSSYIFKLQPCNSSLVINPAIKDEFIIENYSEALYLKVGAPYLGDNSSYNPAYINLEKYYADLGNPNLVMRYTDDGIRGMSASSMNDKVNLLARISFSLKHKTTQQTYSYSKYFKVKKVVKSETTTAPENGGIVSPGNPGGPIGGIDPWNPGGGITNPSYPPGVW